MEYGIYTLVLCTQGYDFDGCCAGKGLAFSKIPEPSVVPWNDFDVCLGVWVIRIAS